MKRDKSVPITSPWAAAGLLTLLLSVAASCGDPPTGGPPSSIRLTSADGLWDGVTQAGAESFRVRIDAFGPPCSPTQLDEAASRLALRTWPEEMLVATTLRTVPSVTPSVVLVDLIPDEPLGDRWFWLDLGLIQAPFTTNQTFEGGRTGVRFRPGSHPAVRLIELCGGGTVTKLLVKYSEAVIADEPQNVARVSHGGAEVACAHYATMEAAFFFSCPPELASAKGPVTIAVSGDVRAQTGASVAGGSWTIDVEALAFTEDCPGFRVPLQGL